MKYEQKDIANLIDLGTPEERKGIEGVLNLDDEKVYNGSEIAEQLWWLFQTPLGYVVRTPNFDEISVSVAKKFMKVESDQYDSCWEVLNQAIRFLFEKMFNEMSKDQKEKFVNLILTQEEITNAFGNLNEIKWSKIAAATVLLAASNHLIIYTTVSSQIATALIGRAALLPGSIALPFLGPLGWLLLAWGINNLLGTSWKQVVPATLYIYCMYERIKQEGKLPF